MKTKCDTCNKIIDICDKCNGTGFNKHTNLTNEIYTEPKQDKYEWVWWVALAIIITYFIGHIIWAIIR